MLAPLNKVENQKDTLGTFKILQDVPIPERKCLFQLLVQHAVDGDEALIQSHHIWKTHSGTNHTL